MDSEAQVIKKLFTTHYSPFTKKRIFAARKLNP